MFFRKCEHCGGNFDSGELVGGTCAECREKIRKRRTRDGMVSKLLASACCQMEMEEVLNGWKY